jgi:DNA invertase Pin-like site-specific DNA recombinase
VHIYLHKQAVDTTTPAGRALFQMMGVSAEFEWAMIRERVLAGLATARAKGVKLGAPTVGADVLARISQGRDKGLSIRAIARDAGVGVSTVHRVLKGAHTSQV